MERVELACPDCGKRLFDYLGFRGIVWVKCARCYQRIQVIGTARGVRFGSIDRPPKTSRELRTAK